MSLLAMDHSGNILLGWVAERCPGLALPPPHPGCQAGGQWGSGRFKLLGGAHSLWGAPVWCRIPSVGMVGSEVREDVASYGFKS